MSSGAFFAHPTIFSIGIFALTIMPVPGTTKDENIKLSVDIFI